MLRKVNLEWESVYSCWLRTAELYAFPDILFQDVVFDIPQKGHRSDEIHWWPADRVELERHKLLDFWNNDPDSVGRTAVRKLPKGPYYTLEMLWHHKSSCEHQAAVFIAAFLFPYTGSSRPLIDEVDGFGLARHELRALYNLAWEKACKGSRYTIWPSNCTQALPVDSAPLSIRFGSLEEFISYIAERSRLILNAYQPVRLIFSTPKGILESFHYTL